ncbi:hypothetical protein bAD24_I09545 [Burkholderia sp. AD24]|nr:hypothetical protein bAD24_I09545 [Burkholderia sp. AD24]
MGVADVASARWCVLVAIPSVAFESQSQSPQQLTPSTAMFLTHEDWAADTTARKISDPFLPWKMLTMTAVESKFLVKVDAGTQGGPNTWLVSGIATLLDLTNKFGRRVRNVLVFCESDEESNSPTFASVTEIRDIAKAGVPPIYVYRRNDGKWRQMTFFIGRQVEPATAEAGEPVFTLGQSILA